MRVGDKRWAVDLSRKVWERHDIKFQIGSLVIPTCTNVLRFKPDAASTGLSTVTFFLAFERARTLTRRSITIKRKETRSRETRETLRFAIDHWKVGKSIGKCPVTRGRQSDRLL